jgi:hypothetical protein
VRSLQSRVAVVEAQGQFGEPKGMGTSAVGTRYQRTAEKTGEWVRAVVNCRV